MKTKRKSKTLNAAAIVAVLGAIEINFHFLQSYLGDYYGASYIVIAVIMAYLRLVTKEPVR